MCCIPIGMASKKAHYSKCWFHNQHDCSMIHRQLFLSNCLHSKCLTCTHCWICNYDLGFGTNARQPTSCRKLASLTLWFGMFDCTRRFKRWCLSVVQQYCGCFVYDIFVHLCTLTACSPHSRSAGLRVASTFAWAICLWSGSLSCELRMHRWTVHSTVCT